MAFEGRGVRSSHRCFQPDTLFCSCPMQRWRKTLRLGVCQAELHLRVLQNLAVHGHKRSVENSRRGDD